METKPSKKQLFEAYITTLIIIAFLLSMVIGFVHIMIISNTVRNSFYDAFGKNGFVPTPEWLQQQVSGLYYGFIAVPFIALLFTPMVYLTNKE